MGGRRRDWYDNRTGGVSLFIPFREFPCNANAVAYRFSQNIVGEIKHDSVHGVASLNPAGLVSGVLIPAKQRLLIVVLKSVKSGVVKQPTKGCGSIGDLSSGV
jgi:hypothetical protein